MSSFRMVDKVEFFKGKFIKCFVVLISMQFMLLVIRYFGRDVLILAKLDSALNCSVCTLQWYCMTKEACTE